MLVLEKDKRIGFFSLPGTPEGERTLAGDLMDIPDEPSHIQVKVHKETIEAVVAAKHTADQMAAKGKKGARWVHFASTFLSMSV